MISKGDDHEKSMLETLVSGRKILQKLGCNNVCLVHGKSCHWLTDVYGRYAERNTLYCSVNYKPLSLQSSYYCLGIFMTVIPTCMYDLFGVFPYSTHPVERHSSEQPEASTVPHEQSNQSEVEAASKKTTAIFSSSLA